MMSYYFFKIIRKGKKRTSPNPYSQTFPNPYSKTSLNLYLKKRYTYDKIVPQRKDWSGDMIELEENQKELQTLSDKLKEIGESL